MNGIGLAAALALLAATETGRRSQIALAFSSYFSTRCPSSMRLRFVWLPHIERELDLAESGLMLAS
jgi:hypothetical protein